MARSGNGRGMATSAAAALAMSGTRTGPGVAQSSALSPLVQSYNQFSYGQRVAQLPRDPQTFTQGAFGPGDPTWPMPIDQPDEGSGMPLPRRWQYPVFWNLPIGIPGTEGLKLANFQTLRSMGSAYSIARVCINKRVNEIKDLEWDIVPTPDAAKDIQGSDTARADWETRAAKMKEFWMRPDRSVDSPYDSYAGWISALVEDLIVCDATALYPHTARGGKGKGLFNSSVSSLDLLDGTTIRPMVDLNGGRPPIGQPAYQSYAWGVPRVDLTALARGDDLDDLPELMDEYTTSQLQYLKTHDLTYNPYGLSCVESVLLPIELGLARQNGQLQWYTEGSVPYMTVVPGEQLIQSPQQVRQLQNALNSIAGDQGWKQKIVVLPPGSKAEPIKPNPIADQFDEFVISIVTMGFEMTPFDIGITPRVAAVQSTAQSKQISQVNQQGGSARASELANWLSDHVFNYWIQEVFGQKDMCWSWTGIEPEEDMDKVLDQVIQKISYGLLSIDGGCEALGMDGWGLDETTVPLAWTAQGPVTLAEAMAPKPAFVPGAGPPPPGGGAPGQDPGQAQPAKPGQPALTSGEQEGGAITPAHAGAQAANASSAETAKRQNDELDLFKRLVLKGKPPGAFRPKVLDLRVVTQVEEMLAKGSDLDDAFTKAQQTVQQQQSVARRDAAVQAIATAIAIQMGILAVQLAAGAMSLPGFIDAVEGFLRIGYGQAYASAADHAIADHVTPAPHVPTSQHVTSTEPHGAGLSDEGDNPGEEIAEPPAHRPDFSGRVAQRIDVQNYYLQRLATRIAAAPAGTDIEHAFSQSFNAYANTTNAAYEEGYVLTAANNPPAGPPTHTIYIWRAESDACALCEPRDGQEYTRRLDLPGWPGDGGYGPPGGRWQSTPTICEGGPRCRCHIDVVHRKGDEDTLVSQRRNTARAGALPRPGTTSPFEGAVNGLHTAIGLNLPHMIDEWVQQRAAFRATLPEGPAARAAARDAIREQLARERHTMPNSIPAQDVADRVPAALKSWSGPMSHRTVNISTPEMTKVGPKGYIHGWIFVGIPGMGDDVVHGTLGHGTITDIGAHTLKVKFDSGEEHTLAHVQSLDQIGRTLSESKGPAHDLISNPDKGEDLKAARDAVMPEIRQAGEDADRQLEQMGRTVQTPDRGSSGGEYDWYKGLSTSEKDRLRNGGFTTATDTNANRPDQVVSAFEDATGAHDATVDEAMKTWLNATRTSDAAKLLDSKGQLPANLDRFGSFNWDNLTSTKANVGQLFASKEDAKAYLSDAQRNAASELADRELTAKSGPSMYEMTYPDYEKTVSALGDQIENAQPVSSDPDFGDVYSAADEAAASRYNELVPEALAPSDQALNLYQTWLAGQQVAALAGLHQEAA